MNGKETCPFLLSKSGPPFGPDYYRCMRGNCELWVPEWIEANGSRGSSGEHIAVRHLGHCSLTDGRLEYLSDEERQQHRDRSGA